MKKKSFTPHKIKKLACPGDKKFYSPLYGNDKKNKVIIWANVGAFCGL